MNTRIALVGLVVVVAAGCSTAAAGASAEPVQPTPQIIYVTPAPTATPTPTPRPTPRPTPVPTPNVGLDSWMTFLAHVTTYTSVTDMLDPIMASLNASDYDTAIVQTMVWDKFVTNELKWLAANPPEACYAAVHDANSEAFRHFAASNAAFIPWLEVFPYGSEDDAETMISELEDGNADLNAGTAAIDRVACN